MDDRDSPEPSDRPRLHFTARRGWINDPHAVTYAHGCYHLFFQHNPAGPQWASSVHWGHATSPDLHTWREEPVAFSPAEDETGCWTGALTSGPDGPVILYTSVTAEEAAWSHGRIRMAQGSPSLREWRRVAEPVLAGPPEESGVAIFRDPCVWRHDDGWTMVIGASIDGRGAALQYSSVDLRAWTYDGVVADAASVQDLAGGRGDLSSPGSMWECPQLFPLDGAWVLLVSVWDDGVLLDVAAAIGDYDGKRFTARAWHRFTYGDLLYATTTFLDAAGNRCALSWLREDPARADAGRGFAGAISLPYALSVDRDRLVPRFHRHLEDLRRPVEGELPSPHGQVTVEHEGGVAVRLDQPGRAGVLEVEVRQGRVVVRDEAGRSLVDAACAAGGSEARLDLVVDGDIVELVATGAPAMMAVRCSATTNHPLRWVVTPDAPAATVRVRAYAVDRAAHPQSG